MKRGGRLTRRTPLRYRSAKTERRYVHRRRLVADLLAERLRCEYHPDGPGKPATCPRQSEDIHELKSRARGGDILDRSHLVALCRPHHDRITTHPAEAEAAGWALHSWERAS